MQAAIEGESYEVASMYPQFIKDAEAEKVSDAVKSFTWAMDTEKKHEAFYKTSLSALQVRNESVLPAGYEVCPVCGNTYAADKVDERCAFCQTPRDKFEKI